MFINIDKTLVTYKIIESIYCLIATVIYYNNQKTQTLVKNFINYFRIKHINLQHYFVKKKIAESRIQLKYVFIAKQVANNLIKSLLRNVFEKFRNVFDFY